MAWSFNDEELAYCKNCGKAFVRGKDEKWKKLCLDCYIAKKEREKQSNYSNNNFEVSRLRRRLEAAEEDKEELQSRLYQLQQDVRTSQEIRRHLKTLISLCHPDKHGGSEAATRATQLLLSLRE